jgi:hypothetical protein
MDRQINLRGVYPIVSGDEATQERYERMVETARMRMTVPLAVAPGMSVKTRRGVLGPGAEVKPGDIEGYDAAHGFVPGTEVLRQLVHRGVVLAAHELPASAGGSV